MASGMLGEGDFRKAASPIRVVADSSRITTSNYEDCLVGIIPDDTKREPDKSLRLCNVQKHMEDLYYKSTCVGVDERNWPVSFAYVEPSQRIPDINQLPGKVFVGQKPQMFFAPGVMTKWLELSPMAKDQLLVLMYAGKMIWRKMKYEAHLRKWSERKLEPLSADEHTELEFYGMPTGKGETVLKYLMKGKSKEECEKLLASTNVMGSPFTLEDSWEVALASGMTNGTARQAVFKLLEITVGLLNGFEKQKFPRVWISNVTSSSKSDGFPVVSRQSTPLSTRASASASDDGQSSIYTEDSSGMEPPPRKRRKGTEKGNEADALPTSTPKQKKRKTKCITVKPKAVSRKFVDLMVIGFDPEHHFTKYIILIEIHSAGKTEDEAMQKFMKEIIHVLQCQTHVFGLFFGKEEVTLLKAVRSYPKGREDEQHNVDSTGLVDLYFEKYRLIEGIYEEGDLERVAYFNVGSFQGLVMSILSCLIHGLDRIDTP